MARIWGSNTDTKTVTRSSPWNEMWPENQRGFGVWGMVEDVFFTKMHRTITCWWYLLDLLFWYSVYSCWYSSLFIFFVCLLMFFQSGSTKGNRIRIKVESYIRTTLWLVWVTHAASLSPEGRSISSTCRGKTAKIISILSMSSLLPTQNPYHH